MKIISVEQKTSRDGSKNYLSITCEEDSGVVHSNVSVWSSIGALYRQIIPNSVISGVKVITNDKGYKSLVLDQVKQFQKPKEAMIHEAQDRTAEFVKTAQERTAEQVNQAQTRNEVMWAKYGACEIIAHHPAYKNIEGTLIPAEIVFLTEKILSGDSTGI